MKVKELIKQLADVDQEARVAVWSWFADGARIYRVKAPIDGPKKEKEVVIIGHFDDCYGDRVL